MNLRDKNIIMQPFKLRSILNLCIVAVALSAAGCSPNPQTPTTRMIKVDADSKRDTDRARAFDDQAADAIDKSDFLAAEKLLNQAILIDPEFGPAHNNLGVVYYNQSKIYVAAEQFLLAAALMPRNAEPRNGLGLVFESSGRLDDAVAYYDRARALDPGNVIYLGNSARARVRRGDRTDEVTTILTRLIGSDSRPDWNRWEREALLHITRSATTEP
jgi:Flp pilus assembly protein TadD